MYRERTIKKAFEGHSLIDSTNAYLISIAKISNGKMSSIYKLNVMKCGLDS